MRAGGPQPTGAYFEEQTAASAAAAIRDWESGGERLFQPRFAREWAATFAMPLFLERYRDVVLRHAPEAAAEMIPVADAAKLLER